MSRNDTVVARRAGKDTTPEDQLPTASRAVRRSRASGKLLAPAGTVHVVQVWTAAPHPRYGDRVPYFVPSYLPCKTDHKLTKVCYPRRPVRTRT